MLLQKGVGEFFGLDIGTTAVRVVQLARVGAQKWTLVHYAHVPIDPKTAEGETDEAKRRLSEAVTTAIGQSGVKTKNVAIGLPSNKTFVTVVDMPKVPDVELNGMIKYQADEFIPMASDDVKVDWRVLGAAQGDVSKQEVLLASTPSTFVEARLDVLENLGLNVIAAEPDSLAMLRAVETEQQEGVRVVVDFGETSTDVAVVYDGMPRLVRTIPNGLMALEAAVVQTLAVEREQAHQFIMKFGLGADKLEGQVVRALDPVVAGFVSELRKSIGFFENRYPGVRVSDIAIAGIAGVIPGLSQYVSTKIALPVANVDVWQGIATGQYGQTLSAVQAEFPVAVGLAQRGDRV